jgi:hypothetical protein
LVIYDRWATGETGEKGEEEEEEEEKRGERATEKRKWVLRAEAVILLLRSAL